MRTYRKKDQLKYRKISVKMWGDKKFRHLSLEAKLLWVYILTCERMTAFGGFEFSIGGTADVLRTVPETVERGLQELLAQGFVEHDADALCIIVPNWFKHNGPMNPNGVTACMTGAEKTPECDIKDVQLQRLTDYINGSSNGCDNGCDNGSSNGCDNGCVIPDPDPEPDPEPDTEPDAAGMPPVGPTPQPTKSWTGRFDAKAQLVYQFLQFSTFAHAVNRPGARKWVQALVDQYREPDYPADHVLRAVERMVEWYAKKGLDPPHDDDVMEKIWKWVASQVKQKPEKPWQEEYDEYRRKKTLG